MEPLHGVLLGQTVLEANLAGLDPPVGNVEACNGERDESQYYPSHWTHHRALVRTGASQDNVKVQAVDTDRGIVLDAQVDVFLDAEAKVAGGGEVVAAQLVLAHLQATLQDLLGLGSAHGAVDGDLLVTTDAERAHGVPGLGVDGLLASQLLQHLERKEEGCKQKLYTNVIKRRLLRFVVLFLGISKSPSLEGL